MPTAGADSVRIVAAEEMQKFSLQLQSLADDPAGNPSELANCLSGRNEIVNLKGKRMLALRTCPPDWQAG